ncbi:MAG: PD40 domain-containing protein, partial [Caldilineaceae bacterium]|nr:PD40 domain-containing protein [Caldilineaceae bacterium]
TPEISATVAATERAGSAEPATATPEPTPEPAPATPRAAFGRLFYSAQNADGQTVIFQLDPDSGTVRQVVENAAQPAIQPGGDRLAFHSTRDDMLGLGGYDLGVQERVRFSFNTEDTAPTWDPAVQQLLFASTRYGDGRWRLYSVWADGRGDAVDLGYGQDPDWHPNEALIVFKGCDERGGRCGLWTMAPDGSARRPLTDNPGDAAPDWSPNGQYVVFMSNERDGNWELYRVDVDSGAVLRLTDDPASDGLPAVSPDGREVAYMTNQGGTWSIQIISIDGSIDGGAARTLVGIGDNVADWLDQGVEWER